MRQIALCLLRSIQTYHFVYIWVGNRVTALRIDPVCTLRISKTIFATFVLNLRVWGKSFETFHEALWMIGLCSPLILFWSQGKIGLDLVSILYLRLKRTMRADNIDNEVLTNISKPELASWSSRMHRNTSCTHIPSPLSEFHDVVKYRESSVLGCSKLVISKSL